MLTAARGWTVLVTGILIYEILCVEEELLSRGMDRLLEKHPVWPRVVTVLVALHVANMVPSRWDVFARVFDVTRLGRRLLGV